MGTTTGRPSMWMRTGLGLGGTPVRASGICVPVAAFSPYTFRLRPRSTAPPSRWFTLVLLLALLLTVVPSLARRADFALPLAQEDAPATMPITDAAPITNAAPVTGAPVSLPPGLGPVLRAVITADNAAEYAPAAVAVAAISSEEVQAANPAQQFVTTFGADSVRVAPSGGSAFSLRATDIATTGGSVALAAAAPVIAGVRVEYRRGNVTEWYVNGPRGLEQGFTLAAPPAGNETAFTLRLAVTVEGNTPTLDLAGDSVRIGESRYSALIVTDAMGATLPAYLGVTNGAIEITVDATGATWPVTVDPTITTVVLSGDDHLRSDSFGQSVVATTLNGTTYIVVGAPTKNSYQGEAYVFAGSAGTYNQRARLTASDGAANSEFGGSVAITPSADGTNVTIVVGACAVSFCANKAYVFTGSGTAFPQQAILSHVGDTPDSRPGGFGKSVAVAITTSGKTTVAVGAPDSPYLSGSSQYPGQGAVYFFEGTGSSYPYLTDFVDAGGNPTNAVGIGASIAFVSNNGTNTLAVGAPSVQVSSVYQGGVFMLTGSGATYTSVLLTASDGAGGDRFGQSVALVTAHGVNTVVAGAPSKTVTGHNGGTGVAYVLTGSGTSYATTRLDNGDGNADNGQFGSAVAVGYAGGNRLIAVGAPGYTPPGGASPVGQGEVALFTQNGATYTQSPSLLTPAPLGGDEYGYSVALTTAVNGDTAVIGGERTGTVSGSTNTTYQSGTANVSYWQTAPAVVDIQTLIGDHMNTVASSTQTSFDGTGIPLVAKVFAPGYSAVVPIGVTFTLDFAGAAHGVFDRNNPGLTAVHVMTYSNVDLSIDGNTPKVPVYPSGTAGTFNVTATVDGLPLLTTTFHLTILPSVPLPTINAVIPTHAANARPAAAPHVVTPSLPPGLSPPALFIDANATYPVLVNGTGFISQALGTTAFFKHGSDTEIQMDCVFNNSTQLMVFVTGYNMLNMLAAADTTATITVYNPPGSGAGGGGRSNPATLVLMPHHLAPANNGTVSTIGTTTLLAAPGLLYVPTPLIVKTNGAAVTVPVTGTGVGLTGANGLITQDGASLISEHGAGLITNDGATIIAQGGGNIIAQGGGNVISNDGGTIIAQGGGNLIGHTVSADTASVTQSPPASAPVSSSRANAAPQPRVFTPPTSPIGDYIASTDANGVIMASAVRSNGIPGTYTRTFAVDGIAPPITYTITNLNPHDGQPTTITSLSKSSAVVGNPTFDLAVTGTGFIGGSVLSFGGVQLVTTFDSATHIHATIPASLLNYPGALDVVVINPDSAGAADGGASFASLFTVTSPPTLTKLSLPAGSTAGGETVTLTGTNFAAGATVSFGSSVATNVTVVNSTTLTAITPAHVAGVVDVRVVSSEVTLTLTQAYTYGYIAPQPSLVVPGATKPGGVSVQPPREPPGATPGAGMPMPMPQPIRH